jgi:hypothetical protein
MKNFLSWQFLAVEEARREALERSNHANCPCVEIQLAAWLRLSRAVSLRRSYACEIRIRKPRNGMRRLDRKMRCKGKRMMNRNTMNLFLSCQEEFDISF